MSEFVVQIIQVRNLSYNKFRDLSINCRWEFFLEIIAINNHLLKYCQSFSIQKDTIASQNYTIYVIINTCKQSKYVKTLVSSTTHNSDSSLFIYCDCSRACDSYSVNQLKFRIENSNRAITNIICN